LNIIGGLTEKIRRLALSFPGTTEAPHFEKTSFRVNKKIFATWDAKNTRLTVKLSIIDQKVFSEIPDAFISSVPNKWGAQGWTIVYPDKIREELLEDVLRCAFREM
jgi:predicted DNA-binding protein (MmcQ/YjbR family)